MCAGQDVVKFTHCHCKVRQVIYIPGAVMAGIVSVEEGRFLCLTFHRRKDGRQRCCLELRTVLMFAVHFSLHLPHVVSCLQHYRN